MDAATRPRRATTSYAVGKSSIGRGKAFSEYRLPDGKTVKILDKDIFDEAVKRGSRAIEKLNDGQFKG